jgi:hypothetical protein
VLARLAAGETVKAVARAHDVIPRLVNLHTGYAVTKVHHHVHRLRTREAVLAAGRAGGAGGMGGAGVDQGAPRGCA